MSLEVYKIKMMAKQKSHYRTIVARCLKSYWRRGTTRLQLLSSQNNQGFQWIGRSPAKKIYLSQDQGITILMWCLDRCSITTEKKWSKSSHLELTWRKRSTTQRDHNQQLNSTVKSSLLASIWLGCLISILQNNSQHQREVSARVVMKSQRKTWVELGLFKTSMRRLSLQKESKLCKNRTLSNTLETKLMVYHLSVQLQIRYARVGQKWEKEFRLRVQSPQLLTESPQVVVYSQSVIYSLFNYSIWEFFLQSR